MSTRILRLPAVEAKVGIKKSLIYKLMKEGKFPQSVRQGGAVGWVESKIDAYIAARDTAVGVPDQSGGQNGGLRKAS